MTLSFNRVLGLALILCMIAITALLFTQQSFGSAPTGLPSTFATTSTVTVGPSVASTASTTVPVFGTITACASRVITTVAQPIMLLWSNAPISSTTANPSALFGHEQLASTTVVYDSGQFGCGYVNAYGYTASTTISISEFR